MKYPKVPHLLLLTIPYLLFGLGFAMNAICMAFNGSQMPVLFPGGCDVMREMQQVQAQLGGDDIIHACLLHSTHLKFLADWIVLRGVGVFSPGDLLEMAFEITWLPALIAWLTLVIVGHEKNIGAKP